MYKYFSLKRPKTYSNNMLPIIFNGHHMNYERKAQLK